jgi:hypothetical protein
MFACWPSRIHRFGAHCLSSSGLLVHDRAAGPGIGLSIWGVSRREYTAVRNCSPLSFDAYKQINAVELATSIRSLQPPQSPRQRVRG